MVGESGEEVDEAVILNAARDLSLSIHCAGPFVHYVPEIQPGGWYALAERWRWPGPPALDIPRGFTYDLASIPRALRWLVSPHEIGLAGPLVHDYLYRHGGVTRLEADRALAELMLLDGVPARRRWIVYRGVRLGGWWAWRKARKLRP